MPYKVLTHFFGASVYTAENGNDGLKTLSQIDATFVLLDLSMPAMDGWETLVAMRSNPDTAHISVAAITAYHSVNVAEDAVEAGFDGYFSKPIDPNTFVDSLGEILSVST